jgi:hypothetical protein
LARVVVDRVAQDAAGVAGYVAAKCSSVNGFLAAHGFPRVLNDRWPRDVRAQLRARYSRAPAKRCGVPVEAVRLIVERALSCDDEVAECVALAAGLGFVHARRGNDLSFLRWSGVVFTSGRTLSMTYTVMKNRQAGQPLSLAVPDGRVYELCVRALRRRGVAVPDAATNWVPTFGKGRVPYVLPRLGEGEHGPVYPFERAVCLDGYRAGLRRALVRVGFSPEAVQMFGLQSLRSGGLTSRRQRGFSSVELLAEGCWSSERVMIGYDRSTNAERGGAARRRGHWV